MHLDVQNRLNGQKKHRHAPTAVLSGWRALLRNLVEVDFGPSQSIWDLTPLILKKYGDPRHFRLLDPFLAPSDAFERKLVNEYYFNGRRRAGCNQGGQN